MDDTDTMKSPLVKNPYKTYKTRWLALLFLSLLSIGNAIGWITFSTISDHVEIYYDLPSVIWVNMLSLIFLIVYIPFVFVSSWVIDQKGLRVGVTVGCLLTAIGAWIRVLGNKSIIPNPWAYWAVFGGQTLMALGQPFVLNTPPKLAANWFPDDQRTLATTIASIANPVGVAAGFVIPPALVSNPSHMPFMLLIEAIIITVVVAPSLIMKGKPPTPPSASASIEKKENFAHDLKEAFSNPNYWVLLFEFGIGLGTFNTLATLTNQLLQPFGYNNNDSGTLGALVVIFGLVGSGVVSVLVDMTKKYKLFLLLCLFGATASIVGLELSLKPHNFIIICVCGSFLGFTMTPVLPLSFETSCEITYPVGEGTTSGFLVVSGQIVGIVQIIAFAYLFTNNQIHLAMWIVLGCFISSFLAVLLLRENLKRTQHDRAQAASINQTPN